VKINTPEEYDAACTRLDELMDLDPEVDSPEGIELCTIADALEFYEESEFAEASDDSTANFNPSISL